MAQDQAGAAETLCDPITLEIVRGALRAIQSEMEAVIERTAMSPFIREKKDFYAALYDAEGRLIAGSNLPVFGDVVAPIAEYYPLASMRPGDVFWFNDCYASKGAVSHSPDQVFVAPVFAEGELAAFAQSWAHFQRHRRHACGLAVARLHRNLSGGHHRAAGAGGARGRRLTRSCCGLFYRNSRFPEMVKGDTRASMAAIQLGERRLGELFGRFGRAKTSERLRGAARGDRTGLCARSSRRLCREGRHAFTDTVDSDGQGHGPIKLRYALEVTSRSHQPRYQRQRRSGAGPGQLPDEPAGAGDDLRLLPAGGLADPAQRRRRAGAGRGGGAAGLDPAADLPGAARACAASP